METSCVRVLQGLTCNESCPKGERDGMLHQSLENPKGIDTLLNVQKFDTMDNEKHPNGT